jgi:hypothetical protein
MLFNATLILRSALLLSGDHVNASATRPEHNRTMPAIVTARKL